MTGEPPPEWLTPAMADALRDGLALIRCGMSNDDEGARVIMTELEASPGHAADVCFMLSELCAELLRDIRPDWLDVFQAGARRLLP